MFKSPEHVAEVIARRFYGKGVLVLGDVMLDRYVWGRVERISPEAPVPVVRVQRTTDAAGGAANVAINLASLGCTPYLAGVVSDDGEWSCLVKILASRQVCTDGVYLRADGCTTLKTRIMGGHQQMIRLDSEDCSPIATHEANYLNAYAASLLSSSTIDAIILSDYAKGLLTTELCRNVIGSARAAGVPVFVDPKGRDFSRYAGATAIAPNRAELALIVAAPPEDLAGLFREAEVLRRNLSLQSIVLTLSELGMALIGSEGVREFPAHSREVFDVSGAGDTAIATLAASAAAGLCNEDAVQLANVAAGLAVAKVGTATVTSSELLDELHAEQNSEITKKICSRSELMDRVGRWRARSERIVFTNGCFDLLHVGHTTLLERAKREGSRLVVAINADESVHRLKGPGRPLICETDRARVLASIATVDAVVMFSEDTPLDLIEAVRPDVLVKGGDYKIDEVVGAKQVKDWGGRVVLVDVVPGHSTSLLLKKATGASK